MRTIFLILAFALFTCYCYSQSASVNRIYPEVGKPMPDFVLTEVHNFSKKQIRLSDFKGKWLVLDWWTQFCTSCIESFPKINAIQKEFSNHVQFFLIGYTGNWLYAGKTVPSNNAVRRIYEKVREKEGLIIPISYDSILYQQYNLGTTPYIVVIDPNGIVRAITTHLTADNVRDLIMSKNVTLRKAFRKDEKRPEYNVTLPLLTYGNGGSDSNFLFRSLLSRWNEDLPIQIRSKVYHSSYKGKFEVLGANLMQLYQYAFIGKSGWDCYDSLYTTFYPKLILEVKDSTTFEYNYDDGKGLYCYSLIVPNNRASNEYLMRNIQMDLERYFGYRAFIESRMMPYWKLTAEDEAKIKLKTKGESAHCNNNSGTRIDCRNVSIKAAIISSLNAYFQDSPPFIDETGIEGNIDIVIDALLTNFNDFRNALQKCGINIVLAKKAMNVLVVKD